MLILNFSSNILKFETNERMGTITSRRTKLFVRAARVMQFTPNVHDLSIFTYYTTRTVKANAFRRLHLAAPLHIKSGPRMEAAFDILHIAAVQNTFRTQNPTSNSRY